MLPWLRATDLGFVTAIGVGDLLGLGHRYRSQYHTSLLIKLFSAVSWLLPPDVAG